MDAVLAQEATRLLLVWHGAVEELAAAAARAVEAPDAARREIAVLHVLSDRAARAFAAYEATALHH